MPDLSLPDKGGEWGGRKDKPEPRDLGCYGLWQAKRIQDASPCPCHFRGFAFHQPDRGSLCDHQFDGNSKFVVQRDGEG